jgi:hypothetical protein
MILTDGDPATSAAEAALAELSDGGVGPASVELLRRLGRQCTRSTRTNFPPPEGYARWCDDAVDHLLADMFAREDSDNPGEGHKFVLDCYLRATDGPSFERLLLTSIENFLKDQAKSTERGKLRRRLTRLLQSDGRFAEAGADRWTLTGGLKEPWQGDLATLERAAFGVRGVDVVRWNRAGPTPKDTVLALLAVTEAVLVNAGSGVRTEDLARVLQARFRLLREPTLVSLDDESVGLADSPETEGADVALRARQIFEGLSEPEQQLLPLLAEPARWAGALGVGPALAEVTGLALIETVRLTTIDDADHAEIVLELLRLCGGGWS